MPTSLRKLPVLEVWIDRSSRRQFGYGPNERDACNHAGLEEGEVPTGARWTEISDESIGSPPGSASERIADEVCAFFIDNDPAETGAPKELQSHLRELIQRRAFAQAVAIVFDELWNGEAFGAETWAPSDRS